MTLNDYNLWVVALSYLVSVIGAFVSLNISDYIRAPGGRLNIHWIGLAAVVFGGCAIWAMHFVGMLAYHPETPVTYDVGLTLLSLAIPIVFTFGGFYTVHRWRDSVVTLLIAGTIFGLGIATMHYTGMAAMRMEAAMTHTQWVVAASILIAVVAAIVALNIFVHWRGAARQLSPFLMGIAVCGMHYTGMAAMQVDSVSGSNTINFYQGAWDRSTMTIAASGAVALALAIGLAMVTLRQISELRTSHIR